MQGVLPRDLRLVATAHRLKRVDYDWQLEEGAFGGELRDVQADRVKELKLGGDVVLH